MCGSLLEARRPAGVPVPELRRPLAAENATKPANQQVPPIAGPSMLGLNHPGTNPPSPGQPSVNQPGMDALGENAFSGLDSFFEPEQPKKGGWRILLMVVLLAALGGAGWWTYTNYLGAALSRKPATSPPSAGETPAEPVSTKPAAQDAAPAPAAGSSQTTVPSAGVSGQDAPEGRSEHASAAPDAPRKTVARTAKPAETKAAMPAKREPRATSAKASKLPAPSAADDGDAAFRKGEAYLYGRGVPKNCDQAVKNLKAASAKSNAKARSAFGTMYATGHCVPRDLPTSYSWFALALRVDPNNQILEKDLSAVWNQMTPPERQMATKMKQ
jgi:cytoskeletal protein RodZ